MNDTFSHSVGDKALKYLVQLMKKICEAFSNAKLYRSGGDEFSILAECGEGCDEGEFKEQVERTAKEICKIVYQREDVNTFTRIGVVCFLGATYLDADKLEHEVKRKIMVKRGLDPKSRDPVYDTKEEERFLIAMAREDLPTSEDDDE